MILPQMNLGHVNIEQRANELFKLNRTEIYRETDRFFVGLMAFQWVFGIATALVISPRTWLGATDSIHVHVWAAIFLGGMIAIFPILLGILRPGETYTRHTIAVGQMLYSSLLIHLMGGRIEAHFHVFGSLAFLSFYRDWKVFIPATVIVAADHWIRGVYWPQSVFGILTISPYRWIEHASWVIFEDIFLIRSCYKVFLEMKKSARATAELEFKNQQLALREHQLLELTDTLDHRVQERTKELRKTLEELKDTHSQLIQSEKLASIGHLAAGIAHEINNPIGFISSNLQTLEEYLANYSQLLCLVEGLKKAVMSQDMPKAEALVKDINAMEARVNLEFIIRDVDDLLRESKVGMERIKKIILDLRTFSRVDTETMQLYKVQEVIDSILGIIHNEIKYKAKLNKEYGDVPVIRCNQQQLGQVFINLLINAVQAIKDKGSINIKTYVQDGYVGVDISDTGQGIEEKNLTKIFDAFFTTKPVGQGTGLGLSVSYDIVKKHGGEIRVKSQVGVGTTFSVLLPRGE